MLLLPVLLLLLLLLILLLLVLILHHPNFLRCLKDIVTLGRSVSSEKKKIIFNQIHLDFPVTGGGGSLI
jgi:hypothetical protein